MASESSPGSHPITRTNSISSLTNASHSNNNSFNVPAGHGLPSPHASAITPRSSAVSHYHSRSTPTAFIPDHRGPPVSGHGVSSGLIPGQSPVRDPRPASSGGTGHTTPVSMGPSSGPRMIGEDGAGPSPPSHAVDTPSSTDAAPPAKKRKTTRGQRGVANLTPEQLERKRANDREAQRAIRERQRLRTEQLEREIAELKSTQPHRELQRERQHREAVEAELADVKRSLGAILAIIQPILGSSNAAIPTPSSTVLAAAASTAPPPPSLPPPSAHSCSTPGQTYELTHPSTSASAAANAASTPTSTTSPVSVGTHGGWPGTVSPVPSSVHTDGHQPPEMVQLNQQRHDLVHNLEMGHDKLGLNFLISPGIKVARIQNGINGAQDSPQYRHVPMKHDWKNASISSIMSPMPGPPHPPPTDPPPPIYGHPPPVTPAISSIPSSASGPGSATELTPSGLPTYAIIPRNCPPTCPLDSLLLDFAAERRQRAAEGLPQSEILGPRYPSVSSLLNPAVAVYSHPLSRVFTDILSCFPDLSALPERVAVLYVMFLVMRWFVAPTQESFMRLPPWIRPLPNQTDKEHPAWFDHLPFPRMRDKMTSLYGPGAFPFDNFFIPFTTTLSLNWPYEDALVLLADPTGEELMINPVFEQHLRNLDNWTLGPKFEREYPELAGCFNLKREDGTRLLAGTWGGETGS